MAKAICIILSIIPAIGCLIVMNRIEPYVMGMPFVLFWATMWVWVTSIFLLLAYFIDPANKEES